MICAKITCAQHLCNFSPSLALYQLPLPHFLRQLSEQERENMGQLRLQNLLMVTTKPPSSKIMPAAFSQPPFASVSKFAPFPHHSPGLTKPRTLFLSPLLRPPSPLPCKINDSGNNPRSLSIPLYPRVNVSVLFGGGLGGAGWLGGVVWGSLVMVGFC